MKSITRTLSVLALSAAVVSPVTLIGSAPAEAYESGAKESKVEFVSFKKFKKFKKSSFKKHHSFKKFHHFKHYKG